MFSDFKDFILREKLFSVADRVLLAVSGGTDSVAMSELFHRAEYSFGIAHCNFSLRGEESEEDEAFVRKLAENYRVPFHLKRFNTLQYAKDNKLSVQMAARELRYQWFREVLKESGYSYIATAHHRDDEVETFLINLSRGTGISGLHGILPKKDKIIRPLLFASREDIAAFVTKEHLSYREDSSNLEDKYLRNRIRHHILPQMEEAAPDFRDKVMDTVRNLREAEEIYLQAVREKRAEIVRSGNQETRINRVRLLALNPLATWTYELLKPYGFSAITVESIIKALDGDPGKTFISSTHRLVIDREDIIITINPEKENENEAFFIYDTSGEMKDPIGLSWEIIAKEQVSFSDDPTIAFLDLDTLDFPLSIRKWEQGDYFYPLGMRHRKKLSDFFIDLKLSIPGKEKTWLLISGGNIAWVIGQRPDERFKVWPETKKVFRIFLND